MCPNLLCKTLESIIRDYIVKHFEVKGLYANCQHGFRSKRSCVTQLPEIMERLSFYFDNRQPVDILYLDFRKAFDSVPHQRLLSKLRAYGVCGTVLKWTRNFLSNRIQHVRVGEARSGKADVLSGIPQGSILGPILFTIFINDMPNSIQSLCHIFADDTKIYNTAENQTTLQADIYKLQEWSETWNLYFNVTKCHVLHMGYKNPKNNYEIKLGNNVQKIYECKEEKDLGVTFDQRLSFEAHVNRVVNKANQILGMIKRSFSYRDKDTFVRLFQCFVRPHVEYANVIWYPTVKKQSRLIEGVQRRATKLVNECSEMSYGDRLCYLKLHSLKVVDSGVI